MLFRDSRVKQMYLMVSHLGRQVNISPQDKQASSVSFTGEAKGQKQKKKSQGRYKSKDLTNGRQGLNERLLEHYVYNKYHFIL